MLCIVYNARCTAGKVLAPINPSISMKISIIRTWCLATDGSRLAEPLTSVFRVYTCFASALNDMRDIRSRYNRLGFQVYPYLGGLSVFSSGNLVASFKFADYED